MSEQIIEFLWTGPFSLADLKKDHSDSLAKGLYQIYAQHPVYGFSLVYIGRTHGQTFNQRIEQEKWAEGSEGDPNSVRVYLGRLTTTGMTWEDDIDKAEALLIHAHAPAYNSTYIINAPSGMRVGNVRILNWGAVKSLHREVSGLMWSTSGINQRRLRLEGRAAEADRSPLADPHEQKARSPA